MTTLASDFLVSFKDKYNLETFVETGCWKGTTLETAITAGFKNIYSCDIVEEHAEYCRKKFPNACIATERSVNFLLTIVEWNLGKTFFWLDAHYPSHYGGKDDSFNKTPLLEELKVLSTKKGIENDVIICDDIKTIKDPWNPMYDDSIKEYFKVNDFTLNDLVEIFKETHDIQITTNIRDGLLMILPRNKNAN